MPNVGMLYRVNEHWTLDDAQLDYLEQIELPFVQDADKILVLLQQGDEVLDYREAQRYYNGAALVISETQGNHIKRRIFKRSKGTI